MALDLQVNRSELTETRMVESVTPEMGPGQALLHVDRFALTSNNVTYAVLGDAMGYWDLFPGDGAWGRVPAWGFADVIASDHDGLPEGSRVFGLVPMSTHLVITVAKATPRGLVDAAPHRDSGHGAYNWYQRADQRPADEDHHALLRPLFILSFLLSQHLDDHEYFGAATVLLSSASSKAALGTAARLSQLGGVTTAGLTSEERTAFVEGLELYDHVVTYGDVAALPPDPTVYLDFSADDPTREAVHRHYGNHLVRSLLVGGTHQQRPWAGEDVAPVARHELFFAPTELAARTREWGREELEERIETSWNRFAARSTGWFAITHDRGSDAVRRTWTNLVNGVLDPATGHIAMLTPGPPA